MLIATWGMAAKSKKPLHFLREWREFNNLSQQDLGNLVGTNASVISLLETGERGLSDKWLRKLAPKLKTRPGAIIDFDPNMIDSDILEIWSQISEGDRAQAVSILKTFRKRSAG